MERVLRRAAPVVAIVAGSLLLSSCFKFESNYTVHDDGTADVSIRTVIDTEQLAKFGGLLGEDTSQFDGLTGKDLVSSLNNGDDPCADVTGSLSGYDVKVEEINDGSETGVECTFTNVPIEKLTTSGEGSSMEIRQDAAGTQFTATLQGVDQLTGGADTADLTSTLGVSLDDLFSIVFSVSAPGSLGDNNATSTSGSTATWEIKPDADFVTNGDANLTAVWTPGGGGSGSNIWIIVAVLAAIATAVALFFALRGRTQQPAPAGATTDGPAPSGPVPSGPTVMSPPTMPSAPPPPPHVAPPTDIAPPSPPDVPPPPSSTDSPPPPPPPAG